LLFSKSYTPFSTIKNGNLYCFWLTRKSIGIPFSHIDVSFLKEYEKWMRKRDLFETSMSVINVNHAAIIIQ